MDLGEQPADAVGQVGRFLGLVVVDQHAEVGQGVVAGVYAAQEVGQGLGGVGNDVSVAGVGLGRGGVQVGDAAHRQIWQIGAPVRRRRGRPRRVAHRSWRAGRRRRSRFRGRRVRRTGPVVGSRPEVAAPSCSRRPSGDRLTVWWVPLTTSRPQTLRSRPRPLVLVGAVRPLPSLFDETDVLVDGAPNVGRLVIRDLPGLSGHVPTSGLSMPPDLATTPRTINDRGDESYRTWRPETPPDEGARGRQKSIAVSPPGLLGEVTRLS